MDFRDALNIVIAELTPQPWDYTTPDGVTLRVIPAGMTADPGDAEVYIRITQPHVTGLGGYGLTTPWTRGAAEVGIPTAYMPALIEALEQRLGWDDDSGWIDSTCLSVSADLMVTVVEGHYMDGKRIEVTESVRLPEVQRLPLASALRRALDVARGWES